MTHTPFSWLATTVLCLVLTYSSATAESVLPAAQGHHSTAFVIDTKTPPPPVGAKVKFYTKTKTGAPKDLYMSGIVLGVEGNIAFIELLEESVVRLVNARLTQDVNFRVIEAPDDAVVEERRKLQANGQVFQLAPHMRRVTVPVTLSEQDLGTLALGETVTFPDAHVVNSHRRVNGVRQPYTRTSDIKAIFVSASPVGDSVYELSLVVDPYNAGNLVRASLQGPLSLHPSADQSRSVALDRQTCYAVTRRGTEVHRNPIPCR